MMMECELLRVQMDGRAGVVMQANAVVRFSHAGIAWPSPLFPSRTSAAGVCSAAPKSRGRSVRGMREGDGPRYKAVVSALARCSFAFVDRVLVALL